jgi:hypothetical protein
MAHDNETFGLIVVNPENLHVWIDEGFHEARNVSFIKSYLSYLPRYSFSLLVSSLFIFSNLLYLITLTILRDQGKL